LLSIVRFVTAASVFYQVYCKKILNYFLWLRVVFQHPVHNLQKSSTINQWHWWKLMVARADKSQDHYRALRTCIWHTPKIWKRRPGRPRHTVRTVEADLRPFNLGLASGFKKAQDRTTWRALTGTATSPTSPEWWWWWWLMESVHIKGAFWGAELTRYQEPQTREPHTHKIFQIPENYSIRPGRKKLMKAKILLFFDSKKCRRCDHNMIRKLIVVWPSCIENQDV